MKRENKKDSIDFRTNSGRHIRLVYESVEYRAYEIMPGGSRRPMMLGSTQLDPLIEYIKERW